MNPRCKSQRNVLALAFAVLLFLPSSISSVAQIRISEIGYASVDFEGASKWVELHNTGTTSADASLLFLCRWPQYDQISTLAKLAGDFSIPPDGYLVVAFPDLQVADGEVGLYSNNTNFGSASNILDYVEYGSTAHHRSGTAVTAGVWLSGDAVAPAAANQSLSLNGSTAGSGAWASTTPTPGAKNTESVGTDELELPDRTVRVYSVFPNPVSSGSLTVLYSVAETSPVLIEVFDLLGRRLLETSVFASASLATSEIQIDVSGLPDGNYLYRVSAQLDRKTGVISGAFVKQAQ